MQLPSLPARAAMLAFAGAAYALFLLTFLYAVGFVGGWFEALGLAHPGLRSLESGRAASPAGALLVDVALLGVFTLQHSGMARQGFKRAWTRVIPPAIERSAYVLASSACLALVLWQWRPLGTAVVWDLSGTPLAGVLVAVSATGWLTVLYTSFLLDHLELFGLRQVWRAVRGLPLPTVAFRTPALYRAVRHPLYLGFILAFWATPRMTLGHLLFAAGLTAYELFAIRLEERDLVARFGDAYREYRQGTRMLLPLPVWRKFDPRWLEPSDW